MNVQERYERLDHLIADNRICRHAWHDGPPTDDGWERMCLLLAVSPEVGPEEDPSACPTELMPEWLAHLTPWIDDAGSADAWPEHIRRYRAAVPKLAGMSAEASRRLDCAVRAAILRQVLPVAGEDHEVVERVLALCDREARGEYVSQLDWIEARAAAEAARAAAEAAAWAAAEAAAGVEAAARVGAARVGAADLVVDAVLTALEAWVPE